MRYPIRLAAFGLMIAALATPATAGVITFNVSGTTNDLGTPSTLGGSMQLDTDSGVASGSLSASPQVICPPWAFGKAVVWVLKTAKPAEGLSLLSLSGGDLKGSLSMVDAGSGTNIQATFELVQVDATTVNASFTIDATYDPLIALTGEWSSSETVLPGGPGNASATGTSVFHLSPSGDPISAPYSVSYQFMNNPSGELPAALFLSQTVNFDLETGSFTAQVNASVIPEPGSMVLLAIGCTTLLGVRRCRPGRWKCLRD
ncbi:MAG: PEP-CTERM sorting domain-containing protein [Isosphaeraceae bacterium]